MKPEERARCLEALESLVNVDPDDTASNPRSTFLPLPSTARALAPDVYVVLGGRGAGKTALFRMLMAPSSRDVLGEALGLSLAQTQWLPCFSAQGIDDPDVGVLEDLADAADLDLRALWACLLLRSVARGSARPLPETLTWVAELSPHRVRDWLPRARAALGEIVTALDALDSAFQGERRTIYCCYDALDRISPFDRGMRRRHLRTLLALWSSLAARHRALVPKIFLREDLLDPAELEFPDASKLLARAASLDWSHEDLSRLVVRYLAQECEEIRSWLGRVKGLTLRQDPLLGWIPGPMPAPVRKAFTTRLVGPAIGTGIFRVETGRWITGRLQDAHRRITPRTVLRFFGHAGEESLKREREEPSRSSQLLDPDDLYDAIRFTSHQRVAELRDDYPVVNRVRNLAGIRIPMPIHACEERLARPSSGELEPLVGEDGSAILAELVRLGVATFHRDGDATFVDIPDIYRFGFGIEADYAAAFKAYIEGGGPALHWLQRGELPELDARLAEQLDRPTLGAIFSKARELALAGEFPEALSMLENLASFARHRRDRWLEFLSVESMAELTVSFDPRLAIEFIKHARSILDEQSDRARTAFFSPLLKLRECLAYIATGNVSATLEGLESLGEIDEQDILFGLHTWVECQVAIRERDPARTLHLAHTLISWARERDDALDEYRGYLAAASAVLISGRSSSRTMEPKGWAPWAIVLEGVEPTRLRLAIMLVLTPVGGEEERSIAQADGESLARRLAAELGEDESLEALQRAAGELRGSLLDMAQTVVLGQ